METEHRLNEFSWRIIAAAPGFLDTARAAGLGSIGALCSKQLGDPVTNRRSSWVRSATIRSIHLYAKTYDYPTPRDRRRGIGRTTLLARSRAAREADALRWFDANGFPGPKPLLVAEARTFALLRRAVIVTSAWGDTDLRKLLGNCSSPPPSGLLETVARTIESWHRLGFRDRNLDPRNLLVQHNPAGNDRWLVAKIDSPRYRLRRAASTEPPRDRLARQDWARLLRGLEELGVPGLA